MNVLDYFLRGQAQREVFQLLWGRLEAASVSALSRLAAVSFSAVHRELEMMRAAGLASSERVGAELHYRAATDHPQAELLRRVAGLADQPDARKQASHDENVRGWLATFGAPLGAPAPDEPTPALEEVLVDGLRLSHRDATVARVLPFALWRQRHRVDLNRLVLTATRRDERQALGFFLELAGQFGDAKAFVEASRRLLDKRRKRPRLFFEGVRGRHTLALTQRNTPREARKWGYLLNMRLESFRAPFEKFADNA